MNNFWKRLLGYRELDDMEYDEEGISLYSHGERIKKAYSLWELDESLYNGEAERYVQVTVEERLARHVEASAPLDGMPGTITYREASCEYESLEITVWGESDLGQKMLGQIIDPRPIVKEILPIGVSGRSGTYKVSN